MTSLSEISSFSTVNRPTAVEEGKGMEVDDCMYMTTIVYE